jgi:hypothetical protein
MKAVLLLLFCFGILSVFSTSLRRVNFHEESYTRESVTYYTNGNLKCKTTVYYNRDESEEKRLPKVTGRMEHYVISQL